MVELLDQLLWLFDRGGMVMWAIFAVSLLMWVLIIERYGYLLLVAPGIRSRLLDQWRQARSGEHGFDHRLQQALVSSFDSSLRQFLAPLHTLAEVLPLLGLLGTLTGMITVFDVITAFGTANARGMASGISEALITTMAGLVTALSGVYFSNNLESLVNHRITHFRVDLTGDTST